jgi:hypothetical protein
VTFSTTTGQNYYVQLDYLKDLILKNKILSVSEDPLAVVEDFVDTEKKKS